MVRQRYTRARFREDEEERRYRGPQGQRRDPETGQFMPKDDEEEGYRGGGRSRPYQEDEDYEGREPRGFAAMDQERRREIARMGAEARWGRYDDEEGYESRGRGREWRGFGSMPPEERREIASMGGQVAHERGTAHEWTSEEAREAGRRGGEAAHGRGTAHEWTPEEAREAGRRGGEVAHERGTAHEWTSEEAREAGRRGGMARGRREEDDED